MNIPATPQPLFPKRMSEATVDVTLELRLWLWARRHFLEGKTPNLIPIGSRIIDEKLWALDQSKSYPSTSTHNS